MPALWAFRRIGLPALDVCRGLRPIPVSLPLLGSLLLSLLLLGCAGAEAGTSPAEPQAGSFTLRQAVETGDYAVGLRPEEGLALEENPRPALIGADHERRPAVLLPPGGWSWRGRVPAGARFSAGAVLAAPIPGVGPQAVGMEVTVTVTAGGVTEVAAVARTQERQWLDVGVDLGHYAGRWTEVMVRAEAPDGAEVT